MNTLLNKKAWKIRRNAAKKFNCNIMEISWGQCLRLARYSQGKISYRGIEYVLLTLCIMAANMLMMHTIGV